MGRLTGFSLGGSFNYVDGKTPGQLSSVTPTVITMTQESAGLYYLDGETTQDGTPTPENPICLVNTYTEGLYKTTIGGTNYYVALNESLRSAGSVKDKLYINTTNNTAYVVKNVGEIIFNGSEDWIRFATTKQSYNLFINATDIVELNDGTQTIVISNRFKGLTPAVILSNDDNSGISSRRNTNRGITVSIDKVLAEKTTDFMNWLSNNNTKVYYALATPITENINIQ